MQQYKNGVFCVFRAATVAMQRRRKHASKKMAGLCFLRGSCRGIILKKIGATVQLTRVELRDISRTVMT
jgi:hypothetical protein